MSPVLPRHPPQYRPIPPEHQHRESSHYACPISQTPVSSQGQMRNSSLTHQYSHLSQGLSLTNILISWGLLSCIFILALLEHLLSLLPLRHRLSFYLLSLVLLLSDIANQSPFLMRC